MDALRLLSNFVQLLKELLQLLALVAAYKQALLMKHKVLHVVQICHERREVFFDVFGDLPFLIERVAQVSTCHEVQRAYLRRLAAFVRAGATLEQALSLVTLAQGVAQREELSVEAVIFFFRPARRLYNLIVVVRDNSVRQR